MPPVVVEDPTVRSLLPLLLALALGTGCGAEPDEFAAPETSRVPKSSEDEASRGAGAALVGRAEATREARARRKATTMTALSVDTRVQTLLTPADLQILRAPDKVRLITGDPDFALTEREIAEGSTLPGDESSPSALIGKEGERGELAFRLLRSIAGSDGSGARCFMPEYTLRFCRDGECMEVSICFSCKRLSVWAQGEEEPRYGTLDRSLRSTVVGLCRKYGLSEQGGC